MQILHSSCSMNNLKCFQGKEAKQHLTLITSTGEIYPSTIKLHQKIQAKRKGAHSVSL